MDDFSITDERIVRALDELRTINTVLGGSRTSREGIRTLLRSVPQSIPAPALASIPQSIHAPDLNSASHSASRSAPHSAPVTVLDIGAGGSDTVDVHQANGRILTIISVDINTGVCRYLKDQDGARVIVCADALRLPFRNDSVDIVHVSLFLHHFNEEEIGRLLNAFLRIARTGVVINDLQRSVFALAGITVLTQLFSKSRMVKNDGPLSVRRGFVRNELQTILGRLPCSSFSIRWRWAFRWLVVIQK